jgi:hypothetical protein
MGASVDLMAGGLTLGAAAALGALLGGGAAYVAAAWKNRATPTGATIVALSDDMLLALAQAALLRYVAVVHWARGTADIDERWRTQLAAAMPEYGRAFSGYWSGLRAEGQAGQITRQLVQTLMNSARDVLQRLHEQ